MSIAVLVALPPASSYLVALRFTSSPVLESSGQIRSKALRWLVGDLDAWQRDDHGVVSGGSGQRTAYFVRQTVEPLLV